jgi:hypothetical protein
MRNTAWLVGLTLSLVLTSLAGTSSARAQAVAVTTEEKVEIAPFFVLIDCANNGAGEWISLSGPLHIVAHITIDARGGVQISGHFQPQGVLGEGLLSGDLYHAVGLTRFNDRFTPAAFPYVTSYINNFYMIGPGKTPTLKVHQTIHLTINANGTVTAFVVNERITCK